MSSKRSMFAGDDAAPSYPEYDGTQPCAQVGIDLYYLPEDTPHSMVEKRVAERLCALCPFREPCLEWALYRERWGYWAGTTALERTNMRRNMGIRVIEPQYDSWLPRREERGDESAA